MLVPTDVVAQLGARHWPDVLTEEAFERTAALGERMAAGLRTAIDSAGVHWGWHGTALKPP